MVFFFGGPVFVLFLVIYDVSISVSIHNIIALLNLNRVRDIILEEIVEPIVASFDHAVHGILHSHSDLGEEPSELSVFIGFSVLVQLIEYILEISLNNIRQLINENLLYLVQNLVGCTFLNMLVLLDLHHVLILKIENFQLLDSVVFRCDSVKGLDYFRTN